MKKNNLNSSKISVLTTCFNSGRYLKDTLESIFQQNYLNYEIILVDAGSNDDTHEILKLYSKEKRLKIFIKPGLNLYDGFMAALDYASGKYIMWMPISDCYNGKSWFKNCVEILDNYHEISMVHGKGIEFNNNFDTNISSVTNVDFPSGKPYLAFWLARFYLYQEHTYCVRKNVYTECVKVELPDEGKFMEKQKKNGVSERFLFFNFDLSFSYNFNKNGYLSYFIPKIVGHVRDHDQQISNPRRDIDKASAEFYIKKIIEYREKVFKGEVVHSYRDGDGKVIDVVNEKKLKSLIKDVITCRMNAKNFAYNYNDTLNIQFLSLINFMKKIIISITRNVMYNLYYRK